MGWRKFSEKRYYEVINKIIKKILIYIQKL